jgi:nitrogen fixation protein NifB
MKELQQAGIEPVQDYAHEYIEASALAWFQQRLERRHGATSLVA